MSVEHIFTDTNLFLHYLTNDIPEQAEAFEELLKGAAAGELVLVTNALVIAEIVWTLESYYHRSKPEIREKVLAILNTHGLEVADGDTILQAVHWYAAKNVDFIDAFNAAWMLQLEVNSVATFDRKHFARFEDIRIIMPGE